MQVRLLDLDVSALMAERDGERQGGPVPSKILRRPQGHDHHGRPNAQDKVGNAQSMKERDEDYHRARELIMGGGEPAAPSPHGDPCAAGAGGTVLSRVGSGSSAGRGGGGGGGGGGSQGGSGRGRGRRAVFRDKDREMQDPDYARRDGPPMYDPNYMGGGGYGMEVSCLLALFSFMHAPLRTHSCMR